MAPDYRPVTTDELVFDIKMGLRKARSFLPRRTDRGDDDSLGLAARVIVEHLELAGHVFFRKPPVRAHSTGPHLACPSSELGSAEQ